MNFKIRVPRDVKPYADMNEIFTWVKSNQATLTTALTIRSKGNPSVTGLMAALDAAWGYGNWWFQRDYYHNNKYNMSFKSIEERYESCRARLIERGVPKVFRIIVLI